MSKYRELFIARVKKAIQNPILQIALDNNAERRKKARQQAYQSLPMSLEKMRTLAHEIRLESIIHLESYIDEFEKNLKKNGIIVYHALDAEEARQIILDIAVKNQAKLVVKSKSMVSEEIHINPALEAEGIRVVETDLGEFIVQIRGEPPAHIITPAVHLRKEDVAKTFEEKLGMPYTTDVRVMNNVARRELRDTFLDADIGISGVHLGVAETGTLCLCTNEGNGRMVTTIPRIHIALMGIERIVPTLADLSIILQLLPRSATGQKLTNYVSFIQSPRRGREDGAEERHLILLDNGRVRIANSENADDLLCIRCGACLNACPVFREIGGHAYASPYPGPIGSLISAELFGLESFGHLAKASSLCGACTEACPVKIDFVTLLLRVRERYVNKVAQPFIWRLGIKGYTTVMSSSNIYHLAQKIGHAGLMLFPKHNQWISWFPSIGSNWTVSRDFPPFVKQPFHQRIKKRKSNKRIAANPIYRDSDFEINYSSAEEIIQENPLSNIEHFEKEWKSLEGEIIRCRKEEINHYLLQVIEKWQVKSILMWDDFGELNCCRDLIAQKKINIIQNDIPDHERLSKEKIKEYAQADTGITEAVAAFADSGTIIVPSGFGRPQMVSLLPNKHIAFLDENKIFSSMKDWLDVGGREQIINTSFVSLISGPSRTADIEMTLTIGVHGPGKVMVICYI